MSEEWLVLRPLRDTVVSPQPCTVHEDTVTLGRKTGAYLIANPRVSSKHCIIVKYDATLNGPAVTDVSRNGTWLDHKRLGKNTPAPLRHGAVLELVDPERQPRQSVGFEVILSPNNEADLADSPQTGGEDVDMADAEAPSSSSAAQPGAPNMANGGPSSSSSAAAPSSSAAAMASAAAASAAEPGGASGAGADAAHPVVKSEVRSPARRSASANGTEHRSPPPSPKCEPMRSVRSGGHTEPGSAPGPRVVVNACAAAPTTSATTAVPAASATSRKRKLSPTGDGPTVMKKTRSTSQSLMRQPTPRTAVTRPPRKNVLPPLIKVTVWHVSGRQTLDSFQFLRLMGVPEPSIATLGCPSHFFFTIPWLLEALSECTRIKAQGSELHVFDVPQMQQRVAHHVTDAAVRQLISEHEKATNVIDYAAPMPSLDMRLRNRYRDLGKPFTSPTDKRWYETYMVSRKVPLYYCSPRCANVAALHFQRAPAKIDLQNEHLIKMARKHGVDAMAILYDAVFDNSAPSISFMLPLLAEDLMAAFTETPY